MSFQEGIARELFRPTVGYLDDLKAYRVFEPSNCTSNRLDLLTVPTTSVPCEALPTTLPGDFFMCRTTALL